MEIASFTEQYQFAKKHYKEWIPRKDASENVYIKFLDDVIKRPDWKILMSTATEYLNTGVDLYNDGSFQESISCFTASWQSFPSIKAFHSLTLAHGSLGNFVNGLSLSVNSLELSLHLNDTIFLRDIYLKRGMMVAEILAKSNQLNKHNDDLIVFAMKNLQEAQHLGDPEAYSLIRQLMSMSK